MEKFVQFRDEGRTIVLVTHDLGSIRNFCDRAIWLEHGVVSAEGDPIELVENYTEAMLSGRTGAGVASARRGLGPIRVERVEMFVDGASAHHLRTGDSMSFRLHFTSPEPVPNAVFAVQIASLGGAVVSAPCSRDVGNVPSTIVGKGTVDIEMSNVSLLPGPYVVHVEVTGFGRQHVFDHLQNALQFDVMNGISNESDGLVTLHPTWRIEGDGVSASSEKFPTT